MRVHVTDVAGLDAGLSRSVFHHAEAAFVFRRGLGDVVSVSAHAVADNFRNRLRSPGAGVFELLKDQDSCALADHKSVAVAVPGAAGFFGMVIARGESAHSRETSDPHGSDGGFGAA